MLLSAVDCKICDSDGRDITDGRLAREAPIYVSQGRAADNDCQATFWLEVRWADTLRRSDSTAESPYDDSVLVRCEFRSGQWTFTVFPVRPARVGVYVGGRKEYFWNWIDDVGDKNEPENPTVYEVRC